MNEAAQFLAVLGGVLIIGGGLITVLFFALQRRWRLDQDEREERILKLTQEERDLYKRAAERVPVLERQVQVLREEVGARGAIAELSLRATQSEERILSEIRTHEIRARRADSWQSSFNRATLTALNDVLAHFKLEPVRPETPPEGQQ